MTKNQKIDKLFTEIYRVIHNGESKYIGTSPIDWVRNNLDKKSINKYRIEIERRFNLSKIIFPEKYKLRKTFFS